MRRALDVNTHEGGRGRQDQHGPRPARQFAQDGDVPVVRLTGRKDHPNPAASARLEDALNAERGAREQAEAALKQANATIQALQTKIAHTEMAHSEALADRDRAVEHARAAEQALADLRAAPSPEAKRAARVRPAEDEAGGESEPVQWWVPGWREGLGRG